MQTVVLTIGIILLLAVLTLLINLLVASGAARRDAAVQNQVLNQLQQQMETLRGIQGQTAEKLQQSLQSGQNSLTTGLQASQQTLNNLHTRIGELQGTSQQMLQVGVEVKRLQEILTSPKLRGQMGEWSLETQLANILPQESYCLQYGFKDGRIVDALIRLSDFSVSIDAKFPLPAFQKILDATTDAERKKNRRQFIKDVTVHIDKIAQAYIRPAEGTLDFALMYIPAENVYYETVVQHESDATELMRYGLAKKVIPVSPNLLYAYLMTVAMGLHGLQIERQAGEIRKNLEKLNADLHAFVSSWDTLGGHLRNANGKYEDTRKHLDRFTLQLQQITGENGS
jgi:DNA recombination protein RmuC